LGDVDIFSAVEMLRNKIFIKGNVDPVNTLLRGSPVSIRDEVGNVLRAADTTNGFIVSSACSIAPPTPPDNIKLMVELSHNHARS
jgi:uroporphyrinogen-III decarboxylase